MTGETLPTPELPTQRFQRFIDEHTDVVMEDDPSERGLTRRATWQLNDKSQILPINIVEFKVIIDLAGDKTIFHEIIFWHNARQVYWIGYDSDASLFSSVIGSEVSDKEVTETEISSILDHLTFQEVTGNFSQIPR